MSLTKTVSKIIGASGLFLSYLTGLHATTIYSTGFEAPVFSLGQLAGQNGWADEGNASHITVENTFAHTGSQAVEFNASGASGQMGVALFNSFVVPAATPVITMSLDYYRASGGTASGAVDVNGFDQAGNDLGLVRWLSNNSLEIDAGNGNTILTGLLSSNTWETISVAYNFSNHTFNVLLNGSLVAANKPFFQGGATSTEFLAGGLFVQSPGSDLTYFDNYSVTATPAAVPEPASFFLIGTALAVVGFKKRKTRVS